MTRLRKMFRALPFALSLSLALTLPAVLPGAASAQVLFKNFSEVQVTGAVSAAASANSHALIMYNSEYDHPGISDLPVTANDAKAVKRLFEGMGYPSANITLVENAGQSAMKRAVFDFTAKLDKDSTVVIYYSGHGISFQGDSHNYIVPVDLDPAVPGGARQLRERIFKDRSVSFNEDVLGTIKLAGPKGVVVFYDACRNSPIASDDSTKAVGDVASFVPAKIQGTAMFYSARPGQTSLASLDSEADANLSVYTRVLVSKLAENPTMRLSDLHAVVQSDVSKLAREKASGHRQHPVFEDELDYSRSDHNEFCLATVAVNGVARCTGRDEILVGGTETGGAVVQNAAASESGTNLGTAGVVAGGKADTERLYWESVMNSQDAREVQSYLDLYPNGAFAPIARLRIERLQKAAQASSETAAEAAFWNSVKDMDDAEMIRLYITQYPEGKFRALAEARIAQLENVAVDAERARARQTYEDAQRSDQQAPYENYLNLYPNGEHASAVRNHLARMQSLYQPSWCRGSASLNLAERTICDHYELGRLDDRLNVAFKQAGNNVTAGEQRDWRVFKRDACGSNTFCHSRVMQERISELERIAQRAASRPSSSLRSSYAACPPTNGPWKVQGVSTGDWLNVRSAPQSSASILGAMSFNATGVSVSNCQSNGWCRVQYGCTSGWAFGNYLGRGGSNPDGALSGVYRVVDHPRDSLLNVRSGPGTTFPIVGELAPDATNIRVRDCQKVKGWKMRWCTVEHSTGAIGWAYGQYLANQWGEKPS